MQIQVDTRRLADKSNDIKLVKNELLSVMEQIEILVLSVNGSWQGDAERAFAEKILYVKQQFSHITAFFEEYSDLLKDFAYKYDQQEAELSSKINLA